jgi:hypothetical protein
MPAARRDRRRRRLELFFAELLDEEPWAHARWRQISSDLRGGYLRWITSAHSEKSGRLRAGHAIDWLNLDSDYSVRLMRIWENL